MASALDFEPGLEKLLQLSFVRSDAGLQQALARNYTEARGRFITRGASLPEARAKATAFIARSLLYSIQHHPVGNVIPEDFASHLEESAFHFEENLPLGISLLERLKETDSKSRQYKCLQELFNSLPADSLAVSSLR